MSHAQFETLSDKIKINLKCTRTVKLVIRRTISVRICFADKE